MAGTWKHFMKDAFPEKAEAQRIDEKTNINDKFLEKIADLTDKNAHNEARLEIAKFLKNKKLIDMYEGIIKIHLAVGYLPNGLSDTRYELDRNFLFPALQQKLGREGANLVWSKL